MSTYESDQVNKRGETVLSTEMLIVPVVVFFIILISIQYALNKIVHLLRDIKKLLDKDNQHPPFP